MHVMNGSLEVMGQGEREGQAGCRTWEGEGNQASRQWVSPGRGRESGL